MGRRNPRGKVIHFFTIELVDADSCPELKHNPNCGEIILAKYGGYCVIGDVVLSRAASPKAAERAVEAKL